MTGFITEDHGDGTVTLFVPTAPNPTNGFVFHVPEKSIRRLKVSSEDAMRSIIGIGVGSNKLMHNTQDEEE